MPLDRPSTTAAAKRSPVPFSILILTRNEAINIVACLESVSWCNDVVVLDSFSTDDTCELAASRGARVFQRRFDDFGSQRNYAIDEIPFAHPWVFHLDADERFTLALKAECEGVINADRHSAYFVANRLFFLGKWIRYSSQFPFPQVRLIKLGEARFAKAGHGQKEEAAARGIGFLSEPYDHYNFSKGIADWVDRHNRYSSEEAADAGALQSGPIPLAALVTADSIGRKRAFKRLHARLPARWLWKFVYLYIIRLGFLDGYPGFAYCMLTAIYDFLIAVKVRERRSS
jgi:glycosyltransferase involved in cell wall biosynthesis